VLALPSLVLVVFDIEDRHILPSRGGGHDDFVERDRNIE
jgi:hypothetical protein